MFSNDGSISAHCCCCCTLHIYSFLTNYGLFLRSICLSDVVIIIFSFVRLFCPVALIHTINESMWITSPNGIQQNKTKQNNWIIWMVWCYERGATAAIPAVVVITAAAVLDAVTFATIATDNFCSVLISTWATLFL